MDIFYLVIAKDSHSDDEYALYRTLVGALNDAKRRVHDAATLYHVEPDDCTRDAPAGWLFYAALEDAFSVHVESIKAAPLTFAGIALTAQRKGAKGKGRR